MKFMYHILILALLLTGCSRAGFDDYVGYWKQDDKDLPHIVNITKDNDNYFFADNILREKDFFGNKSKAIVLHKSDEQLVLQNGFGSLNMALSNSGKTLHVADKKFTRITLEQVEELKNELLTKQEKKAEAYQLCQDLKKQYNSESSEIIKLTQDREEREKKSSDLLSRYKEKANTIQDCTIHRGWTL